MKNTFRKFTAGIALTAALSTGAVFAEEAALINEVPVSETEATEINAAAPIEPMVSDFVEFEGTKMAPVRAVAEHFGYTVEWVDESQSVTLTKGAVYVKFSINENSYSFSRMMPQQLETAPILVNDSTTYVPVSLFTDILNLNVRDTEEGIMFYELRTVTVVALGEDANLVTVQDDFHGEVVINITEDTVVTADGEAVENVELAVGQLIEVEYDNFMTMSIPPQTNAVTIELLNTVTAE